MAVALNKKRIRNSKFLMALILVAVFLTKPLIPMESELHESIEHLGAFLVAFCAMGRLYSSAFLGGHKNARLIDYGPFSMTRNPLYFFSLTGFTGICLITSHLVVIAVAPISFFLIYYYLIRREEVFLREKFGEPYVAYLQNTPFLFPDLRRYRAPETIDMHPRFLARAFSDNIWWFAAFPIVEFSEYLHAQGIIEPLFFLP